MAGVAVPAGAGAALATCATTGFLLAASNFASYTINSYGKQGGKHYDGTSEVSSKRELDEHHVLILAEGYTKYRNNLPGTYSVSSDEVEEAVLSNINQFSPSWTSKIKHHGHLIGINGTDVVHGGYQIIVESGSHNKSIIAGLDGLTSALTTLERCGEDTECIAEGALYSNGTLQKRDSNGFWVSYNDWGFNSGYENDWWQWNEFSRGAQELVGNNKFGFVSQVQSCTSSTQCYAYNSKACFAGGMSSDRTVNSAFVGEAYIQSYGGVDGQCDGG